jgi:hypothetical protein
LIHIFELFFSITLALHKQSIYFIYHDKKDSGRVVEDSKPEQEDASSLQIVLSGTSDGNNHRSANG